MGQTKWMPWVSVVLCLTGVGGIVMLASLGKDGTPDGERFANATRVVNLAGLALLSSPLVAIAALCLGWRHNRRLTVVGLLVAGTGLGVTAWGNVTDYLSWSRRPPPTDQVTYLGGFFAMLGTWAICLAYGVGGLVSRSRWFSGPCGEGSAEPSAAADRRDT